MTPRRPRRGRQRTAPAAPSELPAGFRERMSALLDVETDAFLAALSAPASGLRVNTLRLPSPAFRELAPFELTPLPFPPDAFLVGEEARPGSHPFHAAGLYYLQDPGAMVVGGLPTIGSDARVLDLAAAPGGKATHLAARMGGRGVLVANDVHTGRARELAGNLERCGVRNAVVTTESPTRLADRWGAWFDLVVVDAPCSGESMFHKSEAARREWSVGAVAGCSRRQSELLTEAVRLVRPGGELLYSTCTFAPEENEVVLAGLLRAEAALEIEVLPEVPGGSPARPDWAGPDADPRIARALRLWPHHFPGAGHFAALLRRRGGDAPEGTAVFAGAAATSERVAVDSRRMLGEFTQGTLPGLALDEDRLAGDGEAIYEIPAGAPPLAGVRVLRPGWWLGSARKGRFEPSHALALGIAAGHAAETLPLTSDSAEVSAYLRGEALRFPGAKGWVLITVDGFPLGWGKRSDGVVKNHYPRGLRRP